VIARLPVLAALALAALPTLARAGEFVPYRALYDMTLKSADRDSAVVTVAGQLDEEWSESCDGWTMVQRSALEVGIGGEAAVRLLSDVTTWESRDGRSYRFSVRNRSSDSEDERIEGAARVGGPDRGGTARFEKPKPHSVALPAGTVFPTAHTIAVLDAAESAPTAMSRLVFDGMSGDGLFDVSAVIGRPGRPGRTPPAPLVGLRAWPAQVAFFAHGATGAEPDHEVGLKLYENGVTDEMTLDFGPFRVRATIRALEMAARPTCGSSRAPKPRKGADATTGR
jgi:EipB-like